MEQQQHQDYASLEDLQQWAATIMDLRPADLRIGDPANPYMLRWWIMPRNRLQNVYLHKIVRSDDPRALHDHPWRSTSVIIKRAVHIAVLHRAGCPRMGFHVSARLAASQRVQPPE